LTSWLFISICLQFPQCRISKQFVALLSSPDKKLNAIGMVSCGADLLSNQAQS
jgi:hypothetical protein